MLKKYTWLLCLATWVITTNARSPEIPRDSTYLRRLNKRYTSVHTPRTQWSYQPQEDYYRQSQGVSHGYGSSYESSLRATESTPEHSGYSASPQEYWRPTSNSTNYYYSGSHLGSTLGADGSSYQDSKLSSYSSYQYQRPSGGSYPTLKKSPSYYIKGNLQLQSYDPSGKTKYKKTTLHQPSNSYKKSTYPRVHKPYAKHKYPTRKTVHPPQKNYYQSAYQRYAISPGEMLRYKLRPGDYYKQSTASPSPTSLTQRYHTTERMDDAYPDGSSASEDYSAYNDTHRGSNGSYYETYEEVEKTTAEPEESVYDENTTRGYYGDRIYMSTQIPLVTAPDRAAVKNKYYIVRRTTTEDEDLETIFE